MSTTGGKDHDGDQSSTQMKEPFPCSCPTRPPSCLGHDIKTEDSVIENHLFPWLDRAWHSAKSKESAVFVDFGSGAGDLLIRVHERYPYARVFGFERHPILTSEAEYKIDELREEKGIEDTWRIRSFLSTLYVLRNVEPTMERFMVQDRKPVSVVFYAYLHEYGLNFLTNLFKSWMGRENLAITLITNGATAHELVRHGLEVPGTGGQLPLGGGFMYGSNWTVAQLFAVNAGHFDSRPKRTRPGAPDNDDDDKGKSSSADGGADSEPAPPSLPRIDATFGGPLRLYRDKGNQYRPVFVYGTLKTDMGNFEKEMFGEHGRGFMFVSAHARTRDPFALVVPGPYFVPFLMHAPDGVEGPVPVRGELFLVDPEKLAHLDRIEGVDRGYYDRIEVPIVVGPDSAPDQQVEVTAFVYVKHGPAVPEWCKAPFTFEPEYTKDHNSKFVHRENRDPDFPKKIVEMSLKHHNA